MFNAARSLLYMSWPNALYRAHSIIWTGIRNVLHIRMIEIPQRLMSVPEKNVHKGFCVE